MGIFNFFRKRAIEKRKDEMRLEFEERRLEAKLEHEQKIREMQLETIERKELLHKRKLDLEIKELELDIQELEDEEEEEEPEKTSDVDTILGMAKMFMPNPAPQNLTPIQSPPTQTMQKGAGLTDQDFQNIWDSLEPVHRKLAKTLSDEQLKSFAKTKMPQLDEQTLNKMVDFVRKK